VRKQLGDDRMIALSTSARVKDAKTERSYRDVIFDAICVTALIAYFLRFAVPALRGGFRGDEMANMGIFWHAGALKSLLANIVFWKPFLCPGKTLYYLPLYLYRPGGAIYYLLLYHFFDLDPFPYRIVQISILAASIPLVYYLSRRLASSRSVAFLAVLALCYHPRLANLVFVGAFIYDVLCEFFYFAALAYYVRIREREASLRPLQLLGFLVLYVCALNCKEMAVTLPVIVLIYEFLKSPSWPDWRVFLRWVRSYTTPSLIAGLLTVFYIYGKTHGSGSLASLDPYRPIYSWHNFTASNAKFVSELLFAGHTITPMALLLLWAVVFIYAFLRRDRTLQLMAFWIVIVPLPLVFIVPMRGDAPLYLLLFGWAMIFAKVAYDLITLISKSSTFLVQSFGRSAVTRATIGDKTSRMSPCVFRVVATLVVASVLAILTQRENQRLGVPYLNIGADTSRVIQTFRSLNLRPAHGSSVLLLLKEKPLPNRWIVFFIACLVWNDHSLRMWVEMPDELTPQQQANVDYIISLGEFRADVVRSPKLPKSD
jgi:hypothetical protein